jgi:hypothetical protein
LPAALLVAFRGYFIVVPRPLPATPPVVRRKCLIVAPGPLPAALRRPLQFAEAGSAATVP